MRTVRGYRTIPEYKAPMSGFALVSGGSHPELGRQIASALGTQPSPSRVSRFPDGELDVSVSPELRGRDVYVIQPTGEPVHSSLFQLLLLADACWRVEAARITAVVPYLAYARQDRQGDSGSPVGLRVVADALSGTRIGRLLVVDPHRRGLEAVFAMPVDRVTAVPTLAAALSPHIDPATVVVSPDLGAVKLAEHYCAVLGKPLAVVRKSRFSGDRVEVQGLVGDVTGRPALIVDDMISTGATIESCAHLLLEAGSKPDIVVAATHAVMTTGANGRLEKPPVGRIFVTDTLPDHRHPSNVSVVSVVPLLAEAIKRLHLNRPLEDLQTYP